MCVQDCAVRKSERQYAHGMCVYEIQTMLKKKCDWVHLGSPKALNGNSVRMCTNAICAHTHTHTLTGSTCLVPDISSE